MNCICLVFDRLGAGALGPYGNTWIDTPQFDRLAAESFLFDQMFVDSPRLDALYRSYWSGGQQEDGAATNCLPKAAEAAGYRTALLTDDADVLGHPLAEAFGERRFLDPPEQARPADSAERTQVFRLLAAAGQWLEEAMADERPLVLWVHARAMAGPWDAPLAYRRRFVAEDDPDPGESAEPPNRRVPDDVDPDELLPPRCAYSGQVALLDECLGGFLDLLDELDPHRRTMLSLLGPRGFPLGEHRRVGACDEALYEELIHAAWMLRMPERVGAMFRSAALVQPPDVFATLVDALKLQAAPLPYGAFSLLPVVQDDADAVRDRACMSGPSGDRAIRTPAWYLRISGEQVELYRKPDDRWELNEVASRAEGAVEALREALSQADQAAAVADWSKLKPLPVLLTDGIE